MFPQEQFLHTITKINKHKWSKSLWNVMINSKLKKEIQTFVKVWKLLSNRQIMTIEKSIPTMSRPYQSFI